MGCEDSVESRSYPGSCIAIGMIMFPSVVCYFQELKTFIPMSFLEGEFKLHLIERRAEAQRS